MYPNPLQSYQNVEKATQSGRETEARVLSQAARKLKHCQENWKASDRQEKLDEALKFNQRIWSIFQSELSDANNPLPDQLKANLLQLSAFIDKRIFETLAYPTPEKLTIIIEINQNIAAGLRGKPMMERTK